MNNPELYARSNPFQIRDAAQVLRVYKKKLYFQNTDKILDIGCGTGDVTLKVLAPSIGTFEVLFGVDLSKDMIQYARLHHSIANIQYEQLDITGDVTSFVKDRGTFSKIFSFSCLHWVKDLQKALNNIGYLMKPGGECLLVFPAQCPAFEMYKRMAKTSEWEGYMLDVNDYIPCTQNMAQLSFAFSQMMEKAGISTVECETEDRCFAFTSTKMLKDCLAAINPFVDKMPQSLKDKFIEDCIKTLRAIKLETGPVNENKGFGFSYKLLVAQGARN